MSREQMKETDKQISVLQLNDRFGDRFSILYPQNKTIKRKDGIRRYHSIEPFFGYLYSITHGKDFIEIALSNKYRPKLKTFRIDDFHAIFNADIYCYTEHDEVQQALTKRLNESFKEG